MTDTTFQTEWWPRDEASGEIKNRLTTIVLVASILPNSNHWCILGPLLDQLDARENVLRPSDHVDLSVEGDAELENRFTSTSELASLHIAMIPMRIPLVRFMCL